METTGTCKHCEEPIVWRHTHTGTFRWIGEIIGSRFCRTGERHDR